MKRSIFLSLLGIVAVIIATFINFEEVTLGGTPEGVLSSNWNSNSTTTDQTTVSKIHIKWINWLDSDGKFKEINVNFNTGIDNFSMENAPFKLQLPKKANGITDFINDNRFDVFTKDTITEPELTQSIRAIGASAVDGQIETRSIMSYDGIAGNVNHVVYPGAYPDADLIYYVHHGMSPSLKKLLRFDSALTLDTTYCFEVDYSQNVNIERQKGEDKFPWDKKNILNIPRGQSMNIGVSEVRGMGNRPYRIWDSNPDDEARQVDFIDVTWDFKMTGEYELCKTIPASFFNATTTYPVFTDTDSTFFPDAGTGNTSVDGNTRKEGAFGTARNATTADSAQDTSEHSRGVEVHDSGTPDIRRSFFIFDTGSTIGTDNIDSATFDIAISGSVVDAGDANSYVVVIHTDPAAMNAITTADIDRVWMDDSSFGVETGQDMVAMSATIDLGSFTSSGGYPPGTSAIYNTFTLNATGLTKVAGSDDTYCDTGFTCLGLSMGKDVEETEGTRDALDDIRYADITGTASDPFLTVTHSVGGGDAATDTWFPNFIYRWVPKTYAGEQ